jgi:hypothetical protein
MGSNARPDETGRPDGGGPLWSSAWCADEADRLVERLSGASSATAGSGRFDGAASLVSFRTSARAPLTLDARRLVVEQALVLLGENYVHLPLKAAMHAVDPVQRLRLLQARLDRPGAEGSLGAAAGFHREMSEIFHSVRDLHTNYLLPAPFASKVAFLPFLVEEYWDEQRCFVVSHVVDGFTGLRRGDRITHWNGMTIDRAVAVNAARYAGSNDAARHARGVESLTVRPLVVHLPPDEDWVVVGYRSGGEERELRVPWLVVDNLPPMAGDGPKVTDTETALGLDLEADAASRARRLLYAPGSVEGDSVGEVPRSAGDAATVQAEGEVATALPGTFRARTVDTDHGRVGHVRIFTFDTDDPWGFALEFVRLVEQLPRDGLIVDVRGNGGGHIWAAELLLQTMTPTRITPEPVEFLASTVNLELCRLHARGEHGIDLGPWLPSLDQAVETGAVHSRAFPITPPDAANMIGQRYHGPVVLVTDARCYSATDIFAAGFADHGIGPVLGVDANTGAGGANVWTHGLLRRLYPGDSSPYRELPTGIGMRVSIRRTVRVGAAAGTPLEDLGVTPDRLHRLTERDLTEDNFDLLNEAGALLASRLPRWIDARGATDSEGVLRLDLEVENLDRVDVFVDGRPRVTADLPLREGTLDVPGALGGVELRIDGFDQGDLVARRMLVLGPVDHDGWGVTPDTRTALPGVHAGSDAVPDVLRFLVHAPGASRSDLARLVEGEWGRGFTVEHLFSIAGRDPDPSLAEHFAVVGRMRAKDASIRRRRAFATARALMRRTGFEVQPDLAATVFAPDEVEGDEAATLVGAGGGGPPLPGTEDPGWALDVLRVPQVRDLVGGDGRGVSIGHPDTGYTHHLELGGGALDLDRDYDVLDDDADARDPLKKGFLGLWGNPGHGTSTGSVIVSRETDVVEGAASAATLVPVRAITSVALVFDGNVAKAVEYARQQGCHVISMSLGGVGFSASLGAAITAAVADGILVLAAAGNHVGFVVAPANYANVVAVAASNINDEPWSGSSRGPAVDVSAPGESVHAARAVRGRSALTARSSGTSYAVAHTAGVAALWLAHHGRDALITTYGKQNLQRVFKHLLTSTSRAPQGWVTSEYGAGIVDAHALLGAALPDLDAVPELGAVAVDGMQRLATCLPGATTQAVQAAVDHLLADVPAGERPLYAGELAYLAAQDPAVRRGMTAAANRLPESPTTADAGGTARIRTLVFTGAL